MEKIVRPFQTRDISPPKPTAGKSASESTVGDPVTLQWGKSWQLRVFNTSLDITETFYAVKKIREKPKST